MKKKILIVMIIFLMLSSSSSIAIGLTVSAPGFTKCTVFADLLNIRGGPSTDYPIIKTVKKNTELKVIGRINGWYIVQTNDNYVGMVSGWYIIPDKSGTTTTTPTPAPTPSTNTTISDEEQQILTLTNKARKEAGLSELSIDSNLMKVARDKAKDMVNNNYFSHTSPTYGTPFEMMKSYGVTYKSAGENIAGNSTVKLGFEAWMNSPGHKANILGANFQYIGIGVVDSPRYGKVMVQMFIGK